MKYLSGFFYHSRGFTLPELLVTLAVASLLISFVGAPMQNLVADRRVSAITQEVFGGIMLARSEAIKRQRSISLCSTLNGVSCDQGNSGWQNGWLIFSDENQDGILNNNDQLLQVQPRHTDQVAISWNRGFSLTFNSRGQTTTAGSFEICEDSFVRAIVISMTGRARVEERTLCS